MKKIFLKKNDLERDIYWVINQGKTINIELKYLWKSFDLNYDWISVNKEDDGWVTIWCYWDMKDKKRKSFISWQEENAYNQAYRQYWRKGMQKFLN